MPLLNDESANDQTPNGNTSNGDTVNGDIFSSKTLNGDSINEHNHNGDAPSGKTHSSEPPNGCNVNSREESEPLSTSDSTMVSAIAICGMALRLPSGLRTPQQLWEFLLAKGDARARVPESRYNISAFHDANGKPGTVNTEYGYFLDDDISLLDTSFFSMTRSEVERVDPQQRMMLEVARECFEDAGEANYRGRSVGCYMGSLGEDWCEMFARETQNWGQWRVTGYGDFALANRVSYEMDLKGPRLVSCSTLSEFNCADVA
jgi:hypothetical protein